MGPPDSVSLKGAELELTNQDKLRLKVLASQSVRAIRLDDVNDSIVALTQKGEARIVLSIVGSKQSYVRALRDYLSELFLNISGGYPSHIGRWTRSSGVTRNQVEKLLLLGDPEAVVAVAHAPDLTLETAVATWWSAQSTEIAVQLLNNQPVVESDLGTELVAYLVSLLPFEETQVMVAVTVGRVLKKQLANAETIDSLWQKANRRNAYRVGFFLGDHKLYPIKLCDHRLLSPIDALNLDFSAAHIQALSALRSVLEEEGRSGLHALVGALEKPVEQDVVTLIFQRLEAMIRVPGLEIQRDYGFAQKRAVKWVDEELRFIELATTEVGEDMAVRLECLVYLAQIGEETLAPFFAGRTHSGSVMRRHIAPLLESVKNAAMQLLD